MLFGVISQLTEHVFGWSLVKNGKKAAFVRLHTPENGRRNSGSEMLERLLYMCLRNVLLLHSKKLVHLLLVKYQ